MKVIYRVIILFLIFCGSFYFMSRNIKEVNIELAETVSMPDAAFPTAAMETQGHVMNRMHGYTGSLNAVQMREGITPLEPDQSVILRIQENESEIKKVKYALFSIRGERLMEYGTITALDTTEEGKSVKIKFKNEIPKDTECALEIILTTSLGKKLHFYTRIKYYDEETYLDKKLEFVTRFHKMTLDKGKVKNLAEYMETDSLTNETDLACVTIHSDLETLGYGKLGIEKLTEPQVRIYEYNQETASVELSFYAAADAGSAKPEIYQIREYFRVRYASGQMYLLDYKRTMEAQFDIDLISVKKNEIKLGISSEDEVPVVSSTDNSRMCFVRQGALWYYNMIENRVISVFGFQKEQMNELVSLNKKGKLEISGESYDFERNNYDQHDIRILNMDDAGNIDFMVYGYMNRGDYEGRVGIALYHFYAEREEIEEEVYVPVEKSFQHLKEELDNFGYVNQKNVFYFSVNHTIYRYSIVAKKLEEIADGSVKDYYQMVEEGQYLVWQNADTPEDSDTLFILDLESEELRTQKAGEGESILLLGTMHKNFIFGYARKDDMRTDMEGETVSPMYQVNICDMTGNILKSYESPGYYVTSILVKDNIITLMRVSMPGGKIREAYPDNIINNEEFQKEIIRATNRVTEAARKELYLTFPGGFEMKGKPEKAKAEHVILDSDTTLSITSEPKNEELYYAYAYGRIEGVYETAGEAIRAADEAMGTVLMGNEVIWERGKSLIRNKINGVAAKTAPKGSTMEACVDMLAAYERGISSSGGLDSANSSVFEILRRKLDAAPLNLTGASLSSLFYFLSDNRPVIAKASQKDAVLITGYDELYLYFIQPLTGYRQQMDIEEAEQLFEQAGSVFISYCR